MLHFNVFNGPPEVPITYVQWVNKDLEVCRPVFAIGLFQNL